MGLKVTVQVDTSVPGGGRLRIVNQAVTGPAGVGVPAGGTTGQVLAKTSNADYATGWVSDATGAPTNAQYVTLATNGTLTAERVLTAGTGITLNDGGAGAAVTVATSAILPTVVDAKGDLIVGTAADTVARLPVGATTGHVLTVDPAQTAGIKWAAAPGGGIPETLIDAKGDLIVGSAADTAARLAVGTNGHGLVADSSTAAGVYWTPVIPGTNVTAPPSGLWLGPTLVTYATNGAPASTAANAHNRLCWFPITVPFTTTVDTLEIQITTIGDVGSVQRVGLWRDNGSGRPGTLVVQGTAAADSLGAKQIAISETLKPGVYWVGNAWQGGIPTTQPLYVRIVGTSYITGHQSNNVASPPGLWFYSDGITGLFADNPAVSFTGSTVSTGPARILLRVA